MAAALAGCAGFAPPQVSALSLRDGTVMAAAPGGYCIDTGASRAGTGFAVMAACGAVAGDTARPTVNGLVTVQAGEPGSALVAGAETDLRAFLRTPAGKATLSGVGDAGTVTLRETDLAANEVVVSFEDTAAPPLAGLEPHEWRAFFDLRGHMITVAVRGLAAEPMPDFAGRGLLAQAVAALRAANTPEPAENDS